MAYLGGKSLNGKFIVDILNQSKYDNMDYIEPFIGMGHILRRVENKKSYTASDNNELLIELLNGVQQYRSIPDISKERYYELKKLNEINFETAFSCFGLSYNGKQWGGYVVDSSNTPSFKKTGKLHNYRQSRINYYTKLQNNRSFMDAKIECKSYLDYEPSNCLIYCDPPYENTTGYGIEFNHEQFWNTMREWSTNNIVYVSEYNAPDDFVCIAEHQKTSSMNKCIRTNRIEKLFTLNNFNGYVY